MPYVTLPHTARIIKRCLEDSGARGVDLDRPPFNPSLDSIEKAWFYMYLVLE